MKVHMVIFNENHDIVFEGKMIDLPIKEAVIKQKSMELFRDPDPCIIHQSYAIQKIIMPLLDRLKKGKETKIKDLDLDMTWLDMEHVETYTILWKG